MPRTDHTCSSRTSSMGLILLSVTVVGCGVSFDPPPTPPEPVQCEPIQYALDAPPQDSPPEAHFDHEVIEALAGEYRLVMVAAVGVIQDSMAVGELVIRPTDAAHRYSFNPDATYPLSGWTDIDMSEVAELSLAYPAAQMHSDKPGVQMVYHRSQAYLLLGNAIPFAGAEDVSITSDAGVFLHLVEITDDGFAGTWVDGSAAPSPPQGYFCATRLEG